MLERRFALVRMELIGEPTITPDGQSIQHARFPWQRPGDASHGISLTDIVMEEKEWAALTASSRMLSWHAFKIPTGTSQAV